MILVGVWAVANAIVAWRMRGGYVTGTPEQLSQWTIDAFLGVNLALAFFVLLHYLGYWLNRVRWFNRTGGVLPMPEQKLTFKQNLQILLAMAPLLAWVFIADRLKGWLISRMGPIQLWRFPAIRPDTVGTSASAPDSGTDFESG